MFSELVSMFPPKMWIPLQIFPVHKILDQYGEEENNAICRGIHYLGNHWRCFGLP